MPLLVGGCALFTLLPAQGGVGGAPTLSLSSPDEVTSAAAFSTTQSGQTGTPAPSFGHNGDQTTSPNSVTLVPESSSWAAFALIGLGAFGLVLRARNHKDRLRQDK